LIDPASEVPILPAATVVLVRPGPTGLEVLMTVRPTTMAFAAGMHVFPGGQVDPADGVAAIAARSVVRPAEAAVALGGDLEPGPALAAYVAAIRELFEEAGVLLADHAASDVAVRAARSALVRGETTLRDVADQLDLTLRTDRLIPISRWVTPIGMPRRFDARFFVADLPDGADVSFEGDEVAGHEWIGPAEGLRAMAEGRLRLWLPTSTTLQQLEQARTLEDVRTRMTPLGLGTAEVEVISPDVTRIVLPAAAGVAGQPISTYLIGRKRFIVVDPGDPSPDALSRVLAIAGDRGGAIEAVVLTHVDAGHAAGAQGFADTLGIPVLTGPGGGRPLPYPVTEVADEERIRWTDVAVQAIHAPGPRPDHMALIVAEGSHVISGDLGGIRGRRSIPGPADEAAWAASVDRLRALAPDGRWLAGHPDPAERA
jgi:glyoxylase-like metal-dependent hydrolase (beta-lactamase superfamily II)/8-oxo-dGTP pyrophosphatase MutT (NUDIX family)